MRFETELIPWIDEVENYLDTGSARIGEIKKILRKVDFSNLDYATKARLTTLFDPNCEITEEVFRRQIDLYFSLLESKTPIKMPVFSDYIDWIYSQDIDKLTDVTFDIISSRLLKTTANNLSEPINSFMSRLPYEFNEDIDTMSNSRLGTLINILKETSNNYGDMPNECKDFVERMYLACAVKSEIADKNKTKFRHLFNAEPKGYYSSFNKAYAGVSPYDSWIDEPAKKITYKRMVDYANYQSKVIERSKERRSLSYMDFEACAKELKLPFFPSPNQTRSENYKRYYLKEPREYKTYAKKLSKVFALFVKAEVDDLEQNYYGKLVPLERIEKFAVTNDMKSKLKFKDNVVDEAFLNKYAMYLIDLIHLDELTGQAAKDIYPFKAKQMARNQDEQITIGNFNALARVQNIDEESNKTLNEVSAKTEQENLAADTEKRPEVVDAPQNKLSQEYLTQETEIEVPYEETQVEIEIGVDAQSLEDFILVPSYKYDKDLEYRIVNNLCEAEDLPELYEKYNTLLASGARDLHLENLIFDLEIRLREESESEQSSFLK